MSAEVAQYAGKFQLGTRVRITVPLEEGRSFQEWGVVRALESDLLELDLPSDHLAQQHAPQVGRIAEVGLLDRKQSLGCRGMVVGGDRRRGLVLRLLEGVYPYEPREFFRQDVYLPLDYRLPPSQLPDEVRERWRQARWSLEFALQEPESGEAGELALLREELRARLERRQAAPPVAANLSGNGVRLVIPERLRPGLLVELSIYLPQAGKVLEIVGEVVEVSPLPDGARFSTALSYRLIDEGDRDRLIALISAEQLRSLAQLASTGVEQGTLTVTKKGWRTLRIALGGTILFCLLGWQAHLIVASRERGEKHEIERLFEEGIRQFLRQSR